MASKKSDCTPPIVLALLMADDARRDPLTGKYCIFGTFNIISAPAFPCRHSAIAVYVSLIGGHGTVPVTVRLVDVDEAREPVFAAQSQILFTDPMAWLETSFVLDGPVFPEPGEYRLQFGAAGELVRELRLKVRLVPRQHGRPAGGAEH